MAVLVLVRVRFTENHVVIFQALLPPTGAMPRLCVIGESHGPSLSINSTSFHLHSHSACRAQPLAIVLQHGFQLKLLGGHRSRWCDTNCCS